MLVVLSLCGHARASAAVDVVKKRQSAVLGAVGGPDGPGKRQRVRQALRAMFDYPAMARQIEDSAWARLTAADRVELRSLLWQALIHQHEVLLHEVRRDKLQLHVTGEATRGAHVIVTAVAERADRSISYDVGYVMDGTRVVDLRLERSSLAKMWRRQISRKLRDNELGELKTKLRASIAKAPSQQSAPAADKLSEEAATLAVLAVTAAASYLVLCGVVQYFGGRPRMCGNP